MKVQRHAALHRSLVADRPTSPWPPWGFSPWARAVFSTPLRRQIPLFRFRGLNRGGTLPAESPPGLRPLSRKAPRVTTVAHESRITCDQLQIIGACLLWFACSGSTPARLAANGPCHHAFRHHPLRRRGAPRSPGWAAEWSPFGASPHTSRHLRIVFGASPINAASGFRVKPFPAMLLGFIRPH